MDFQQIVALVTFASVFTLLATRWIHRVAVTVAAGLVLVVCEGLPPVLGSVLPEVLLVTAGLMVLTGFVKRSGLAAWAALKVAKLGRGRPAPLLVLLGLLSFLLAALLGPLAAVLLVVPVALLLAVELDVAVIPYLVVLSWSSLWGGATVLTAQPGNLWIGQALGIDGPTWFGQMLPLTSVGMALTLPLGLWVFRKQLKVTNERRARVLEYEEARSLSDPPLVWKTLTVLGLVVLGLVLGPLVAIAPSTIVVAGAVLLAFLDQKWSLDRPLADIDGAGLLFFGALFPVVAALGTLGLPDALTSSPFATPLTFLWLGSLAGAFVDHGAVQGAFVPVLHALADQGNPHLWVWISLGTTLGAGATIWGATSAATALGLAGQAGRGPSWKDFVAKGLLFWSANLAVFSLIILLFRL